VIVADTNVVSEMMRRDADPAVLNWFAFDVSAAQLCTSSGIGIELVNPMGVRAERRMSWRPAHVCSLAACRPRIPHSDLTQLGSGKPVPRRLSIYEFYRDIWKSCATIT
jgi:hypothetical protein